ncbi:MAG: DEAD/DEAH box helicase [Firmicutes bacterium]|nr:DEAD/DEAH box helicase [Bacillota bacterium]
MSPEPLLVMPHPLRSPKRIKPDDFQIKALEALLRGSDVLVAAPTGSGKTWIAEQLARRTLADGSTLIYTSPLKALSNQKYRSFSQIFGESAVGLITGDVKINSLGRILVMTTEIFRNMCLDTPEALEQVSHVVFDEFHWIDSDRGTVWEEAVIFAPAQVRFLCLSATVPNYDSLATWLEMVTDRLVETVVEKQRPVPLAWRWVIGKEVYSEKEAVRLVPELIKQKKREREQRGRHHWWDEDTDHEEFMR